MISKSVVLRCPREHAFLLFTEQAGQWWPADRRHTDDPASAIVIQAGGRFFERGADGTEVELGMVKIFEPPTRLMLDWYPGTGPADATSVDIRFETVAGGTRVTVHHSAGAAPFEVFARNAPAYARSWDRVMAAVSASA